jgi:hypothetical protein
VAGSAWDDVESLHYVLWRLNVGSSRAMFPPECEKKAPSGSSKHSKSCGERDLMRAKAVWLGKTTTALPTPLDALRLRVGQQLQNVDARPDKQSPLPPFPELLALLR